ncbi:hypothetical protein IAD21_03409 [Abditibacteriota bacterium]|nr:hypothetical protein IAD21_03409 [Abditibacteriota bacterium]
MNPLFWRRLRFYLVLFGVLGVIGWIIKPTPTRAYRNARRSSCQSSLRQIGMALQMYAADYDECLPPRQWGAPLMVYAKDERLFQCPETNFTIGTTDYFFNSRFCGVPRTKISSPRTLIVMGDGSDNAPFDATLGQLPPAWLKDESSPAWRHLDGANYGFADGHVKWLKAKGVSRDFRVVTR